MKVYQFSYRVSSSFSAFIRETTSELHHPEKRRRIVKLSKGRCSFIEIASLGSV
ncbi:unnamed protein product [Amoebophrya sp. A120]|nr:unnamed protein product [Amoebophrya sp. A120]|eukprot:GSA120T00009222001.1